MVEKLRQLKKKSHMTNQQIAGKSNIPESTVARIFSGKTPNPTVTTVIAMARAMGGSAADLLSEADGNSAQADSGSLSEPQSGRTAASIGSREMPDASDDESSAAERAKMLLLPTVRTYSKMVTCTIKSMMICSDCIKKSFGKRIFGLHGCFGAWLLLCCLSSLYWCLIFCIRALAM